MSFNSVYTQIWRVLLHLAADPYPDVCDLAMKVLNSIAYKVRVPPPHPRPHPHHVGPGGLRPGQLSPWDLSRWPSARPPPPRIPWLQEAYLQSHLAGSGPTLCGLSLPLGWRPRLILSPARSGCDLLSHTFLQWEAQAVDLRPLSSGDHKPHHASGAPGVVGPSFLGSSAPWVFTPTARQLEWVCVCVGVCF